MTKTGLLLLAVWTIGIFLVIYNLGGILLYRWRLKSVFRDNSEEGKYSYLLSRKSKRWQQLATIIEDKTCMAGINCPVNKFLAYTAVLGACGVFIGCIYLENIATVLPLALCFGLIPWAYISYFISKKQRLMAEQLSPAIQYFISEYGAVPHVVNALARTAGKIKYPLSEEVERLVMELNSGKDREKALFSFARRINNHWALRFAHLLNSKLSRGIDINPPLLNLLMDMKTRMVKEKERGMESAAIRIESYALYLFTPLMYFLGSKINPESHYLLTQTSQGKGVMFVIVILAAGGLLSLIRLNNSRVK